MSINNDRARSYLPARDFFYELYCRMFMEYSPGTITTPEYRMREMDGRRKIINTYLRVRDVVFYHILELEYYIMFCYGIY